MQRRRFLGGLVIGSAALAASPAFASELPPSAPSEGGPDLFRLFAPLERGSSVGLGYVLVDLTLREGNAVLTLARGDEEVRVHLSARQGKARGVASSAEVDFVLMNDGDGARETDEAIGRVLKSLAMLVGQNESAELCAEAGLLPHRSASGPL